MHCSGTISLARVRSVMIGLGAGGLMVAIGCRGDELQEPAQSPDGTTPAVEMAIAPPTGLVGEWKLDETGGTTATDTKNGYNATVFGGAGFIAGNFGNALNLNNGTGGTGGKYAEMPSNATLDAVQEGDYTISAWFYPYSLPPDATLDNRFWAIVTKAGQHMGLVYNSVGKFSMRHYMAGPVLQQAQGATVYPVNAWYHVVGTVNKANGTVMVYVNGNLQDTGNFTDGSAAFEYGSTPFRIGKAGNQWAANGRVDQVRIYNRELSAAEVADLYNESSTSFRMPLGMTKGNQYNLVGQGPMPDGLEMAARNPTDVNSVLSTAQAAGSRIALRLHRGNQDLDDANFNFHIDLWEADIDAATAGVDPRPYLRDGTLVGVYAIDEPFADFKGNMSGDMLEDMCQYLKSKQYWGSVPCLIRDLNTTLAAHAPTGGYQYVDAGWAQIADHQYVKPYNGSMQAYFQANLDAGADVNVNLALVYGFNLINGGREFTGCDKPGVPPANSNNCAMTPDEVREVADALKAIGDDKGCGVNGWRIDPDPGAELDYYNRTDVQTALQYMHNTLASVRPRQVCSLHDLPAP